MKQPPVATVYYTPSAPDGQKIKIEPDPIPVQAGIKTLVWLQEEDPPTPWRFSDISFGSATVFRNIIVQDRVITAIDVNDEKQTLDYTIRIVDETTFERFAKDPQIENEFP